MLESSGLASALAGRQAERRLLVPLRTSKRTPLLVRDHGQPGAEADRTGIGPTLGRIPGCQGQAAGRSSLSQARKGGLPGPADGGRHHPPCPRTPGARRSSRLRVMPAVSLRRVRLSLRARGERGERESRRGGWWFCVCFSCLLPPPLGTSRCKNVGAQGCLMRFEICCLRDSWRRAALAPLVSSTPLLRWAMPRGANIGELCL
jgi:hypothetical protein